MTNWPLRFLQVASQIGQWSKDSTKVGAVAVDGPSKKILETGYNGIPRGVLDRPTRMMRPDKYKYVCHAEQNLVAHAARSVLAGSTVYVTHAPCCDCAKLLINAGVKKVVYGPGETHMSPDLFATALTMFKEADVEVEKANV
jgi:dCMP deaminase